jgi:hypothetical protein
MRRLENGIENYRNRTVTYELPDGRRLDVDRDAVERYGIREIAKAHGVEMPTERVPVFHHGERVGTVPAEFDPAFIKSKSLFYDPRPGDFTRTAEGWVVDKMMGPGDVASVPGFQAEARTHREHW